jgi:hypothetical protein
VNSPSQFRGGVTFQPIGGMAPNSILAVSPDQEVVSRPEEITWLVESQEAADIPAGRRRTTVLWIRLGERCL